MSFCIQNLINELIKSIKAHGCNWYSSFWLLVYFLWIYSMFPVQSTSAFLFLFGLYKFNNTKVFQ